MNVASKIILVACLGFFPILGFHTWLSLEREEALFRSDMERDLSVLGAHLREVAVAEGRRSGSEGIGAILGAAAHADAHIVLEWRPGQLGKRGLEERQDTLVWLEPVVVDGAVAGEIALTESLAPVHAYLRSSLKRLGLLTLILVSSGLLAVRLMSDRLIGRRLDRLVEFASEIGAGRLGQSVDAGGHDEITRLGFSLEAMSKTLAEAHHEAERHHSEHLRMLQQLRHADRLASLGRLAGSVAHELGTPLNVVLGHANRISRGKQAPNEIKESAETIQRQVSRMETIIRDILGFARQTPGEKEQLDLITVVNRVVGLLRPLAKRRGVELGVDDGLASAPIWGREVQVEQALSNLVSNAIDASPESGQVVLALSREERVPEASGKPQPVFVARVLDQGAGIDESDVANLFEPFYTSKKPGQGTGLGLWLSDGIVREHGGSIEVENCSERGACFAMVLPAIDVKGEHD